MAADAVKCYQCRDGQHSLCVGVPCECPCPPSGNETPDATGELIEEFDRLYQAVEGYRCGSLTREGLMHYYEIARQFRIAHPDVIPTDESR